MSKKGSKFIIEKQNIVEFACKKKKPQSLYILVNAKAL